MDRYVPFTRLTGVALEMVLQRNDLHLSEPQKEEILSSYLKFPAKKEVKEALQKLKKANLRLFTLTNSPLKAVRAQLENAKIDSFFEECISVDEVKRLKPAKAVYDFALKKTGVTKDDAILVAAHGWDTTGASFAGWHTALVLHEGVVPDPIAPPCTFMSENLLKIADLIVS